MNKLINKLLISLTCKYVGTDEFNNKYYESRKVNRTFNRKARYVIYKGLDEASKVPAQWEVWLNNQTHEPPKSNNKNYKWEATHTPNVTGTARAYFPPGHIKGNAKRQKATGDYSRWVGFENK